MFTSFYELLRKMLRVKLEGRRRILQKYCQDHGLFENYNTFFMALKEQQQEAQGVVFSVNSMIVSKKREYLLEYLKISKKKQQQLPLMTIARLVREDREALPSITDLEPASSPKPKYSILKASTQKSRHGDALENNSTSLKTTLRSEEDSSSHLESNPVVKSKETTDLTIYDYGFGVDVTTEEKKAHEESSTLSDLMRPKRLRPAVLQDFSSTLCLDPIEPTKRQKHVIESLRDTRNFLLHKLKATKETSSRARTDKILTEPAETISPLRMSYTPTLISPKVKITRKPSERSLYYNSNDKTRVPSLVSSASRLNISLRVTSDRSVSQWQGNKMP